MRRTRSVVLPEALLGPATDFSESLEQDPITIMVQLPEHPAQPKWGCDGTTVALEQVPLTLLIGSLRDRIAVSPLPFIEL